MSNQFIGLTMLVTLSAPPGAQLRGVVSSIEPGKSLTLRNVTCPANGKYVPEFTINAAEIVELIEAGNENSAPPPRPPPHGVPHAARGSVSTGVSGLGGPAAAASPVSAPKTFEDPAILSVGRRPAAAAAPVPVVADIRSVAVAGSQWRATSMERVESARTTRTIEERVVLQDITPPAATLIEPLQDMSIAEVEARDAAIILGDAEELAAEPETILESTISKGRRARKRKQGRRAGDESHVDPAATPAKETTRSKGWRSTPLLEPNPSFQPFATLKKQRGRGKNRVDENGWATEDATDVQEMPDFDFVGSLAKFDKHSIFEKIQAEDSIAEEDRLVSHNRLPKAKPGTAGGKNLHYTENVLEVPNGHGTPKTKNDVWKSEADDTEIEERQSMRDTGSGRQSRRAESKLSTSRGPGSRKGSAILAGQPARTGSIVTPASKPSFHLVPSNRRCEPISALQMLNLENIADSELGLSEDMMTENAGRGTAEVALSALNTGGTGLIQGQNHNVATVVVLAGNNKSGFRGVAAGRHIRNHGVNVVVCVLGIERESELLVGLKRQLKVFRSFGGKVVSKTELLSYIKSLETPIELIIDGLLGLTISFEELRTGEQATAYELIEWANRSKAAVLAIDIPTGIEPTSGKISIIDGRQLYIHARYVVAMGAPKKGLLEAMALGEGVWDEAGVGKKKAWQLFVSDIGLGTAVWKKAGTRVRRGVDFEGSWVVGMRYQAGAE